MCNKAKQKLKITVKLCGWCGTALGSANTVSERVCIRCQKLLTDAGLTDEEIFSGEVNRQK